MTEEELISFDAINLAEDRTEAPTMSGNHMIGMEISSVTVGKKAVFSYNLAGGETSAYVVDLV